MKKNNNLNKGLTASILATSLVAPLLLQSQAASAQDKGYAEVTAYRTMMKADGESANPLAVNLRIGTNITDLLSLEGSFGFGAGDDEIGNTNQTVELNSLFGANVVGQFDVNDSATLFGRVGFAQIDVEAGDRSFDEVGFSYGMGFRIKTSFYGSVLIEYTNWPDIETKDGNIKAAAIGIGYHLRY